MGVRRWVDGTKCLSLFMNLEDGDSRIGRAGLDYCGKYKWKGEANVEYRLGCGSGLF